jgi:hypothetical protein
LGVRKFAVFAGATAVRHGWIRRAGGEYHRTRNHSRIEVLRMAPGLLGELHPRGQTEFGVDVREMGLHRSR